MTQDSYHYAVMRRALDLIDAADGPLALDDLAGAMGMSGAHFQRVFSAWVGISPKRYQQHLSLGLAREMLRDRRAVLEVADAVGLSGPSRLHDLFVRWEAMTPGTYAKGGEGLTIREGTFETPFGPAVAMATEHGLCALGFAAETGEAETRAGLRARWPAAAFVEDPQAVRPLVEAALGGEPARLHVLGAPFQIKVWEALLAIPEGRVATYGEVAAAIGHPRAVRAVGTAIGRNQLAWLIPCHRALRGTGALGGYRWGLPVKRAMLGRESARTEGRGSPVREGADAAGRAA